MRCIRTSQRGSQSHTNYSMVAPINSGGKALCVPDISHFHGRLRDRKPGTRWMGRGCDSRERTLGNVRCLSLDDHLGDGVGRCGSGTSTTSRPGACRAEFGLRVPDQWNASLCLPLATSGVAESARGGTATSRALGPVDAAQCSTSYPVAMAQRSQWASRAQSRRLAGISGGSEALGSREDRRLTSANYQHCV